MNSVSSCALQALDVTLTIPLFSLELDIEGTALFYVSLIILGVN